MRHYSICVSDNNICEMKLGGLYDLELISIPKSEILSYCSKIMGIPIVYILFNLFSRRVYVGKTTNPISRFSSHSKEKDWWDNIIVIKSKNFNNSIIEYVESELISYSKKPNLLFQWKNQQSSSRPHINDMDKTTAEETIGHIIRMLQLRGLHFYGTCNTDNTIDKIEGPQFNTNLSIGKITFLTCCNKTAWINFNNTLMQKVDLSSINKPQSYTWGVNTKEKFDKINIGDHHFFVRKGQNICLYGKVYDKIESEELSKKIYGDPQFKYIYLLDNIKHLDISFDVIKRALNYKNEFVLQGFKQLNEGQSKVVGKLVEQYL